MRPSVQLRFWAHELAAMAKIGLEFAANEYDRDRYERAMAIAEGIAGTTIDDNGRVVLIKRADNGRWALPGGYADVGTPPSANALRELHEETGFAAELERLVGVYDNKSFASVSPYQFYICCFRGRITGGEPTPSIETTEVVLTDPAALPDDMSLLQRTMLADSLHVD